MLKGSTEKDAQPVVPAPLIAEAVTGVEITFFWERDSYARCRITEIIVPAEPVGEEEQLAMHGLFITQHDACPVFTFFHATGEAVSSSGDAWPELLFNLLAERCVEHGFGIRGGAILERNKEYAANGSGESLSLVVIKLPFGIRLQFRFGRL